MANEIIDFQRKHGLFTCSDEGSVVWKHENGLVYGIIVGQNSDGEKMMIENVPEARVFKFTKFPEFLNAHCYFDFKNPEYNRAQICLNAFQNFQRYNLSNERYLPDFKFEFPHLRNKVQVVDFDRGIFSLMNEVFMVSKTWNATSQKVRSIFRPSRINTQTTPETTLVKE